MITKITVETKKGHRQETMWDIEKSRIYPTIGGPLRLEWRNGECLFPKYEQAPGGLDGHFHANLLRSDFDPDDARNTRQDYAGYEGNPGEIIYRGNSLGETAITLDIERAGAWPYTQVRGFRRPTPSEQQFIEEQVVPGLLDFINKNRVALYREAIDAVREYMRKQLADRRADLDNLEREADLAVARLHELHLGDGGK